MYMLPTSISKIEASAITARVKPFGCSIDYTIPVYSMYTSRPSHGGTSMMHARSVIKNYSGSA